MKEVTIVCDGSSLGNGRGNPRAGAVAVLGYKGFWRAVGEFLGFWRLIGDTGQSGGPLIVGAAADAFGLVTTALILSGIGAAAALTLALLVRETKGSAGRVATPA